jgi:hypothetical protein
VLSVLIRCARTAVVVLAIIPGGLLGGSVQTLSEKLSQPADYTPAGPQPLDQLIDLAKHYQLPMGIEWVDEPEFSTSGSEPQAPPEGPTQGQPKNSRVTLLQLVRRMVARIPGYTVSSAYGVLLISKPDIAQSQKNPLNLKIPAYQVQDADAYAAEFQLRVEIELTLNPPDPTKGHGYGGGYGHPSGNSLSIKTINIAGQGMTVREILSRIAGQNEHILWVVHLAPSETKPEDAYFAQGGWPEFQLIPLS